MIELSHEYNGRTYELSFEIEAADPSTGATGYANLVRITDAQRGKSHLHPADVGLSLDVVTALEESAYKMSQEKPEP